jgi:D-serine deaminase-like pyridoxal phosphate-dependent protein
VDVAALDELGGRRIGWHFKGFPATFADLTVAEVAAAQPALSEMATPLMVLDAAALEHNLATMARYCAEHGVDLAPHGKTTMAPQLFRRQLEAGAWGITAATVSHVRVYRAFGVPTVLLANQILDPDALGWIARELKQDPDFRFLCFADSVEGVGLMQAALAAHDAPRPVDVIVDVGAAGGRTGVRTSADGEAVGRAARDADRLRLVGVGGFEGAIGRDRSAASLQAVRAFLRDIRDLAIGFDRAGLFDQADEIILTAGGSAYFDDVVEIFAEARPEPEATRPVRRVLRSGAYITHDDGHYTELTPFRGDHPGPGPFQAALRIRGRVLSMPEPGLALLDFGKRDAPIDLGLPVPLSYRDGIPAKDLGMRVKALADQHAFLTYDVPEHADVPLAVGDIVVCGISHPCTAFDKWRLIPVVEDGRVVDAIRTFF